MQNINSVVDYYLFTVRILVSWKLTLVLFSALFDLFLTSTGGELFELFVNGGDNAPNAKPVYCLLSIISFFRY